MARPAQSYRPAPTAPGRSCDPVRSAPAGCPALAERGHVEVVLPSATRPHGGRQLLGRPPSPQSRRCADGRIDGSVNCTGLRVTGGRGPPTPRRPVLTRSPPSRLTRAPSSGRVQRYRPVGDNGPTRLPSASIGPRRRPSAGRGPTTGSAWNGPAAAGTGATLPHQVGQPRRTRASRQRVVEPYAAASTAHRQETDLVPRDHRRARRPVERAMRSTPAGLRRRRHR